jgi:hypothetical protein
MFQTENPFSVLGIPITASSEEVAAAWKVKVEQLHPDRYPNAPEEILEKLTGQVSRVNAAYEVLKRDLEGTRRIFAEPNLQNDYYESNFESTGSRHKKPPFQRVVETGCEVCGSLETDRFSFTRQVGLIFMRRVGKFEARLCKNCALALGREYQSKTITTGWWGTISFFANFAYIAQNAGELMKAKRLKDPESPVGFRTSPLDPGLNIAQRPVTWLGPIVIAVVFGIAAVNGGGSESSGNSSTYKPSTYTPTPTSPVAYDWDVGNCVSFGSMVYPVSCSSVHSGKIVATSYSSQSCPLATESYVVYNGRTYCIDENL